MSPPLSSPGADIPVINDPDGAQEQDSLFFENAHLSTSASGHKTFDAVDDSQSVDGAVGDHEVVSLGSTSTDSDDSEEDRDGEIMDLQPVSRDGGDESEGSEYEESEEDDMDSEEDEDEEEPALKYERIGGSVGDLLRRDSASSLAISNKLLALGTHGGLVHILNFTGERIKSFKPHSASVTDICLDATADFVATSSLDGQIVVHSLSTPESYLYDMKRPMRTVAFEPNFAKRTTRALVFGGMAGSLVYREKGWLGYRDTILHSGEGPIWHVRWRDRLIAWANDLGVKIYDTVSQSRITSIERPASSPRADLFKCTLHWQDDTTLLIGWADHINVVRLRQRPRSTPTAATINAPPLLVEVTAAFQLDCMISGIVPHILPSLSSKPDCGIPPHPLTSFLILAYEPPDTSFLHGDEMTEDRAQQARKAAERPELRIISRAGEELTADALSVTNFQSWGCNDYVLVEVDDGIADVAAEGPDRCYVVLSPKDLVIVRPRDQRDHIQWLVERKRYEEALEEVERLEEKGLSLNSNDIALDAASIGERYIKHLVAEGDFAKAAKLCPKVCAQHAKRWEDWTFVFAQNQQLQTIIPFIPTESPRLSHLVYEMILGYFLTHDKSTLLETIRSWPRGTYDIPSVIVAVQSELDRFPSSSSQATSVPDAILLMECLAELYIANRQPGKALSFFLRLRKPNVFDLIRDNNLFTDVKDQVLLLVEFDQELKSQRKGHNVVVPDDHSEAITLLVNHTHSIPTPHVVQQLQTRQYYLFLYLDALFNKDPYLASDFADLQVTLCAEFATPRLLDFLRASNYYSLETAYNTCQNRDLVLEMVFLLGRMGNNKKALTLIIERLGDVQRAIEFAKEQSDDDLWEDLLKYSETRPAFIRGLLENVGAEINPIRLIRRIKNGLEIPGLKEALIKILHDFHLQISLLEGCQTIMDGDSSDLAKRLQRDQTNGFFIASKSECPMCSLPLLRSPQDLVLLFLCRHIVHASCIPGFNLDDLPHRPDYTISNANFGGPQGRMVSGRIAFASVVKAQLNQGCPACHRKGEGERTLRQ